MTTFTLPEECPTCKKKVVSRNLSMKYSYTEEAEYDCGARLQAYIGLSVKPNILRACPKSPAEQKKQARRDELDAAVARALTRKMATYEECEEFVRRMDMGRYGQREGIWLALPVMKED